MEQPRSDVREPSVDRLDALPEDRAAEELRACCAADAWVRTMVDSRPFGSLETAFACSDAAIQAMDDTALDQALAAHARIGERREGTSREAGWSRDEQACALAAGDDLQAQLEEGNRSYEERFGHVFLIRAAGRSAEEMYAALQARLAHDATTERSVVRHELADIVRLRLTRLVRE